MARTYRSGLNRPAINAWCDIQPIVGQRIGKLADGTPTVYGWYGYSYWDGADLNGAPMYVKRALRDKNCSCRHDRYQYREERKQRRLRNRMLVQKW